jgi:protease I
MKIAMSKKLAIIATNGYEDLELHYPRIRLHEAGYDTELISLNYDTIHGKYGYPISPDLTINEANPDDYIGLVLPGGSSNPDHLRRYQKVLDFIKSINDQNKLIAAICHAGWVLISAKVINNRRATCFYAIKDDLINAGAKYEDSEVMIDGNLITSRMPSDLPAFMKKILDYLSKQ